MLETVGADSMKSFIGAVVPSASRQKNALNLPAALSETDALARLRTMSERNQLHRSYIGMGFSGCIVPPVIQRNLLENPGWYTQYTP